MKRFETYTLLPQGNVSLHAVGILYRLSEGGRSPLGMLTRFGRKVGQSSGQSFIHLVCVLPDRRSNLLGLQSSSLDSRCQLLKRNKLRCVLHRMKLSSYGLFWMVWGSARYKKTPPSTKTTRAALLWKIILFDMPAPSASISSCILPVRQLWKTSSMCPLPTGDNPTGL